jgi:hypothetical protein
MEGDLVGDPERDETIQPRERASREVPCTT